MDCYLDKELLTNDDYNSIRDYHTSCFNKMMDKISDNKIDR